MNSECSICFEIVRSNDKQKPVVTRCGHLFHENCIKSCLQNDSYGKCPQCNQPVVRSQLIRVYINETENAVKGKDELIEQLQSQLHELNEKAQLQYDLIGSLNRQLVLEKELSRKVNHCDFCQPKTVVPMSPRLLNASERIVAPAKLSVDKTMKRREDARSKFSYVNGFNENPFFKFSTGSNLQIGSQSQSSNHFSFGSIQGSSQGSSATFSNFDKVFSQHSPSKAPSKTKSSSDQSSDCFGFKTTAAASGSQTRNLFAPTQSGTTPKQISLSTSPLSTVKKRNLNSTSVFNGWKVSDTSSVPSSGMFGGEREPLPLNLSSQLATSSSSAFVAAAVWTEYLQKKTTRRSCKVQTRYKSPICSNFSVNE